jgi:hypothetical protein
MARLPRDFICGHDTSYDEIDDLPANAEHGEVAYVSDIQALVIYDATATAWLALTPIVGATTPGTSTGVGTSWTVTYVGCLAIAVDNPALYQCTAITPTVAWEAVSGQ